MPYAAVVSGPVIAVIRGRAHYRWTVLETLASQTTEFALPGAPAVGTVTLYRAVRTAGTGTLLNPRLGRAAGFALTGNDWIGTNSATASPINDATSVRYAGLVGGALWCRNYPNNAAADHSISTEIEIVEGHDA